MSMKTANDPRRVYLRDGSPIICFGGLYFGAPAKMTSAINHEKTVKVDVLAKSGGRSRISVTQRVGAKKVTETWTQQNIVFQKR